MIYKLAIFLYKLSLKYPGISPVYDAVATAQRNHADRMRWRCHMRRPDATGLTERYPYAPPLFYMDTQPINGESDRPPIQ